MLLIYTCFFNSVEHEIAQNITLNAEVGVNGWDVYVSWAPNAKPLFYNVTLFSERITRSVWLPGVSFLSSLLPPFIGTQVDKGLFQGMPLSLVFTHPHRH